MLTGEQLKDAVFLYERGWRIWEKETKDSLYLCPLKDFENVPDGTEMYSIGNKKVVKGIDKIDDDTRLGLLAYGVKVKSPSKYRQIDEPFESTKHE